MKVTFKPGDILEVEDTVDAGPYAGCIVGLIKSNYNNKWWLCSLWKCGAVETVPEEAWVKAEFLHTFQTVP